MTIQASDFSGREGKRSFLFGLETNSATAALRRLADEIDAGTVLLSEVKVTSLAAPDDFTTTVLAITMAQAEKAAAA